MEEISEALLQFLRHGQALAGSVAVHQSKSSRFLAQVVIQFQELSQFRLQVLVADDVIAQAVPVQRGQIVRLRHVVAIINKWIVPKTLHGLIHILLKFGRIAQVSFGTPVLGDVEVLAREAQNGITDHAKRGAVGVGMRQLFIEAGWIVPNTAGGGLAWPAASS